MLIAKKHVPELDGVRGIACLFVVIAHCLLGPLVITPGLRWDIYRYTIHLLLGGVDLFFVLSGFLIGGILLESKDLPHFLNAFWIRRAARILPVAYLLIATYAIALLI